MNGKRILLETYGCTMNRGEGELAGDNLSRAGKIIVKDESSDHDTVMVFTCAVIETTERKMWNRIERAYQENKNIIVGGCLASLRKKEILGRYPQANVIDSMGLTRLGVSLGGNLPCGSADRSDIEKEQNDIATITPISTGCKGSCTYCITRYARGGLKSYPPSSIREMIESGVTRGQKEILLTSQDSASYGFKTDDGSEYNLGTLISNICNMVPVDFKMRVGMMNPDTGMEIARDLVLGYSNPNVFKFFHIPLQSGCNEVLGTMNRRYTLSEFHGFIDTLRSNFPSLNLSTDIIVGFPGETDDQFQHSVQAIRTTRPDILNITRFSSREGTAASRMKGHLPGWIVKERSREMTAVHKVISQDLLFSRIGEHRNCLVTEVGKVGTMMARDENYTPLVITGDRSLLGKYVDITSNEVGPSYLKAGRNWTFHTI